MSSGVAWKKEDWSTLTSTKVTVFHEKAMRQIATTNSKMQYLNVEVEGLSGIPHPALRNIHSTQDVLRLRQHIKCLSRDYLTAERLNRDNGSNPQCKLCYAPLESVQHVLTQCTATIDIHSRMLPELLNVVLRVHPTCDFLRIDMQAQHLTQWTSLNLPPNLELELEPTILMLVKYLLYPGTGVLQSVEPDQGCWSSASVENSRKQ